MNSKVEGFLTQSAHVIMDKLEEIAKKEQIDFMSIVICFLNIIQTGISDENAIRLLSGIPMKKEEKNDLYKKSSL